MLNIKRAFTLFEIMVVMAIISIVVIVTIGVQKPYERGISMLYQRAYKALALATYNVSADLAANLPDDSSDLCLALADEKLGYLNTSKISCSDTTVSYLADSFPEAAVQFVTSNGIKTYFTPVATKNVVFNGITYPIKYRVIFFDLNGDKKPNTALGTDTQVADIVGFIVLASGEVFPIGRPEIDKRYISAKVHYLDGAEEDEVDRYSDSLTYYDAKSVAWGQTLHIDEPKSINFNESIPEGSYIKTVYPAIPVPTTMVRGDMGCILNTTTTFSPCEVEFNTYR